MSETVSVHRYIEVTEAEGPGRRLALWVQGCSLRCKGCFEKGAWDREGGHLMSVAELLGRVARSDVEGVTVLGGEPTEQAVALAHFLRGCRELGKNSLVFSGHTYGELLASRDKGIRALLECTDVLVDGPYDADRPEKERPLVGSANQRFIALSTAGTALLKRLEAYRNKVEVRISPDGLITLNGMWK